MALVPPAPAMATPGSGAYSRKQKSLGLLCTNFVKLYDRDDAGVIGLEEAARKLGVERRRIYDIVNILEIVGMTSRNGKGQYLWIGFTGIPKALKKLKERGPNTADQQVHEQCADVSDDDDNDMSIGQRRDCENSKATPSINGQTSTSVGPSQLSRALSRAQRKEHSLSLLCQKFIKLFVTSDVVICSLEDAADMILTDKDDNNRQAKIRRLYDIANVLSSLNLIEKSQHPDTKKPAFRWLGPNANPNENSCGTVFAKKPMASCRTFGTDITNTEVQRSTVTATEKKLMPNENNCGIAFGKKPLASSRTFGTDITNTEVKRSGVTATEKKLMDFLPMESSRTFGTDITNTEVNRTRVTATEKKLMDFPQVQSKQSSMLTEDMQVQGSKDNIVFGPFQPIKMEKKRTTKPRDWAAVASEFGPPQYHNPELAKLVGHYVEAWKSWNCQSAG